MRVVCLDVGERRIGVAVTDPLDITAQGVETIWSKGAKNDIARVKEICAYYQTNRLLLGLPRNMDGSEGYQAAHSREFGDMLVAEGFEVRYYDERLTTTSATRVLIEGGVRRDKRKNVVDKLAACYILQSFMDSGGWKVAEEDKNISKREVFRMANEHNSEFDMEQDFVIELTDDEGASFKFTHLLTMEYNGNMYICLAPAEPMEDASEDEVVILRIETEKETGDDIYVPVEDDDELNGAFEEYLRLVEADEIDE